MTSNNIKVLVIRFSSIGDIVLTSPVVRVLKKQLNAEVHFLTKKAFQTIPSSNPYIDRVWSIEKDLGPILNDLAAENFNYLIDLHQNLRSARVKQKLSTKKYVFHKLNVEKWLMVNLKINRLPDRHIVDRYLDTLKEIGGVNDGEGLDFFIPEKEEVEVKIHFKEAGISIPNGYIALVIGAAHATKRLPKDQISALIHQIPYPIALLGGPSDSTIASELQSAHNQKVLNCCGNFNILQSASLVKQSNLVISHDTGLMHIAAAFQKPIISIWGNTIPAFGMYPYFRNGVQENTSFEVKGLSCRPCSKIGHQTCPKKHFKCMTNQNLEYIALEVEDIWTKIIQITDN